MCREKEGGREGGRECWNDIKVERQQGGIDARRGRNETNKNR